MALMNHHSTRFIVPMVTDTDVGDAAFYGNKSRVGMDTTTIELSIDNGICGTASLRKPYLHASLEMHKRNSPTTVGCHATANATPSTTGK
jgi:hypothetical protein